MKAISSIFSPGPSRVDIVNAQLNAPAPPATPARRADAVDASKRRRSGFANLFAAGATQAFDPARRGGRRSLIGGSS